MAVRNVRAPLLTAASSEHSRRNVWLGVAVYAATLLAYGPALRAGFIWNDSDYVTSPALQSAEGFRRIWLELGATEQYYPFLHSAFWLEHQVWGDAPLGYHLFNVLLHATSACLLGAVVRRLLRLDSRPGADGNRDTGATAWLAAFLFALHPVYVESVAWISEQKNTLSLVFYLLAALVYLRFDARRNARSYLIATGFFVVALLTKSVTATLPAALLVVFWWRRGRIDVRKDVVPLLPWFALGASMGLLSAHVERVYIGAHGAEFALTLLQRSLLAGRIAWFYLGKLLWPDDLIFIYPRWNVDPSQAWQWLFSISAIMLLLGLWIGRRRTRAPLAAVLYFGGSLFPTLGFFNVYAFMFSFVADHWQYLPSIGFIVLAAGALPRAAESVFSGIRVRRALAVLGLAGLGLLTFHQSRMYADMRTFYATTLARNPDAWMAHNNLGNLLRDQGDLDGARRHLEAALRVRPDLVKAHNNLGNVLRDQRKFAEAQRHYEQALTLKPNYPDALNNLGSLLRQQGRAAEATPHLLAALRIEPDYADARNNLGMALRDLGRMQDAITHFERVVRDKPQMAAAHLNLALTLSLIGRNDEATRHYEEARRLNPAIPKLPVN